MVEKTRVNFIHRWVDGFFVAAHNTINPSPAEWEAYANEVAANRDQLIGTLVYTAGGSPNAVQRKQLRDAYLRNGDSVPCAILTSSAVARAAITAFNLFFNNRMKAIPPHDIDEGLRYLKAPPERWPQLKQALEELMREVGVKPAGYR